MEALAEELLEILVGGSFAVHLSSARSMATTSSHLVQPGHDRRALTAQVLLDVLGVLQEEGDLLQREPEPAVDHHVLKPCDVVAGVERYPRASARWGGAVRSRRSGAACAP